MSQNTPTGLETFLRITPLNKGQPIGSDGNPMPPRKLVDFQGGAVDDPTFQVGNQIVGRTLVHSSTSPTAASWTTALDLDFTAQPNQTLATDTTYTIAGLTARKTGSAQDRTAMAIVGGTGLQIDPKQGDGGSTPPSLYNTADPGSFSTNRNAPILSIPLLQVLPNLDASSAVRVKVWSSIAYGNFVGGLTNAWAQFGFENILGLHHPGTPNGMQCNLQRGASVSGQRWISEAYVGSLQVGVTLPNLDDYAQDVGLVQMPSGLYTFGALWTAVGTYASGFPTVQSMAPMLSGAGAGSSDLSRVDPVSSWAVYLAGINEANTGVSSTYQATITFKRLVIETA